MRESRSRSSAALLCAALLAIGGCAGAGGVAEPVPAAEADGRADRSGVRALLARDSLGAAALGRIAALEAELGPALHDSLAAVAADSASAPGLRINALGLLAARNAGGEVWAFDRGLRATSVAVRVAAAAGLGELLPMLGDRVVPLLERALADAEQPVQTSALKALADYDVAALRDYLAAGPPSGLRPLAEQLVRVAESRGAPVARPADGAGELERRARGGVRVIFRPDRRWPGWEAALGELSVAAPGGEPVMVAGEVEVVGGVIPAFVAPDGGHVVYEAERTIRVRDLRSGSERTLGAGIAPRTLPFTRDFVFLRERRAERRMEGQTTTLRYDVVRASFTGGGTEVLGTLSADARPSVRGHYSAARWMRVRQRGSSFYLEGDGVDPFRLPDPFDSTFTAR